MIVAMAATAMNKRSFRQTTSMILLWSLLSLLQFSCHAEADDAAFSPESTLNKTKLECDENSHPAETTRAAALTPNTFHKICPLKSALGQPMCGDETPFSFYYTSPVRRRSSSKVLLEFMGGGACWSGVTCQYQSDMLTFPYHLDQFLGKSCSEIQTTIWEWNGERKDQELPFAVLCAQTIGNLNFQDYHTIVIPYCTQDVFSGSNTATYNDTGMTVHHNGARNLLAVLDFIYRNFPHPEHIVLTGCSAGATALPMAYDLLYHHYNRWSTGHGMPLATLMDSPVYLTPTHFLQHGLANWNAKPLMQKLRFDYTTYSQREDYSTKLMEHVLKRGSKLDPWGIITHSDDPVSLKYYDSMAVEVSEEDMDRAEEQQSSNSKAPFSDEWWSLLSYNFNQLLATHANVARYIISGEGHCSFGLYFAQTEGGDDFERWASHLLQFRTVKEASGMKWFGATIAFGCWLLLVAKLYQRRQLASSSQDSNANKKTNCCVKILTCYWLTSYIGYLMQDAPITITYGTAMVIYFARVISWSNLENWIYNPSLGPTAKTLSTFGINNPTLIIDHQQYLRLVTSTFLCSGSITFALALLSLFRYIRPMEHAIRRMSQTAHCGEVRSCHLSSKRLLEVWIAISCISNLLYACFTDGASCSSLAVILGLQAFSCTMHSCHGLEAFPRPVGATLVLYIMTSLFLPFNNWIMMASSILTGILLACLMYSPVPSLSLEDSELLLKESQSYGTYTEDKNKDETDSLSGKKDDKSRQTILVRRCCPSCLLFLIVAALLALLLLHFPTPDTTYEQPFLTGCDFAYTTDVGEIVENYADLYPGTGDPNEGERRRRLVVGDDHKKEQYSNMCAQFCVPYLFTRPFLWSAQYYTGFDIQRGWCDEVGFSEHIADKTLSYKVYSVDVELYYEDANSAANSSLDTDD